MTAPEKKLDDSSNRKPPPHSASADCCRRLSLQARHASPALNPAMRLLRLTLQARHASPALNPAILPEETTRFIYSAVRLSCLGLVVLALLACGRSVGKPPAAPPANVIRPVVYVPADLDLVLRLDVSRFRETMGAEPEQTLEKMWEAFGESSSAQSHNSTWLVPALKSTDTLWLGCRLGAKGCKDFVFVLRGRFASARESYGFGPEKNKRDLGAGWFSFDFAPIGRSAAARLYWRPPELAVVVSSAEIDSAERSLEHSQDTTRLEPSETGLMSLSACSKALALVLRERSPKAADWLSKSERIELRFEPSAKATVATFSVSFLDSSQAETAAQAFRILVLALSGFDRRINAGDIDVQQLNSDVVLRISFPTAEQTHLESISDDPAP